MRTSHQSFLLLAINATIEAIQFLHVYIQGNVSCACMYYPIISVNAQLPSLLESAFNAFITGMHVSSDVSLFVGLRPRPFDQSMSNIETLRLTKKCLHCYCPHTSQYCLISSD